MILSVRGADRGASPLQGGLNAELEELRCALEAESIQDTVSVGRLRKDYDKPLRIAGLARQLGMSTSGLHHHFKSVTAMSPLQFQKQIRLQEARRLLLTGDFDAATAGYEVGYDDAARFNREYKRLFGEPPLRDLERLRG